MTLPLPFLCSYKIRWVAIKFPAWLFLFWFWYRYPCAGYLVHLYEKFVVFWERMYQVASTMARLTNTVVFLPTALRRRTRRNAIRFETYKRTTDAFFCIVEKTEMKGLPDGSAAFIPTDTSRGLSPRFGKKISNSDWVERESLEHTLLNWGKFTFNGQRFMKFWAISALLTCFTSKITLRQILWWSDEPESIAWSRCVDLLQFSRRECPFQPRMRCMLNRRYEKYSLTTSSLYFSTWMWYTTVNLS